jgi:UTP--glucose-1-phosphate uridylyltransferase
MLPLIDKPIIQYVVEGMVAAGIHDIIIVTGYSKRAIEDHFDAPNAELAAVLTAGGKEKSLEALYAISNMANFVYVRQKEPIGNVSGLVYAAHLIKDEPFIYTWADEFIQATPSLLHQMFEVYDQTNGAMVLPCIRVTDDEDYDRYGVVGGKHFGDGLIKMSSIIEKPGKAHAPSDLASVGGYLLTSDILPYVERLVKDYDGRGELKLQHAMQAMIDEGHPFYAMEVKNGRYYDAGNKLEYAKTVVDIALQRKDIGKDFRTYLLRRLGQE